VDNRGSPEGERVIEDALKEDARRLEPELVAWRRRLHRRPELAFEERETARFVAERLRAEGFEVHEGLAGTGVVGILRALHGPSPRPAVLLRADMDGLPIQEVSGREYGSELPGRMHACGHDGHVAMLLGAARLLAARRSELRQDVVVCFQPGEEGAGGARKMIEAGVLGLASVRWAFAIHLWSLYPEGTIHVRSGPSLAAQDEFTARLKGPGGHGGMPHLAADPVVAACQAVVALQAVVSRSVDPLEAAVLTVGSVEAGSAPNVIPEVAELRGTLRSFREEVRALLVRRLREVLEGAARAGGCGLELELRPGYPAVVNDPRAVEKVRRAARETVGEGRLFESPPLAVSEDFAYFLERVPGALVLLGAGDPARGIDAPHHSPRFDISESALKVGAELFARLALDLD
jgi:amidohydrolase